MQWNKPRKKSILKNNNRELKINQQWVDIPDKSLLINFSKEDFKISQILGYSDITIWKTEKKL